MVTLPVSVVDGEVDRSELDPVEQLATAPAASRSSSATAAHHRLDGLDA
jgi:hypothetical protein